MLVDLLWLIFASVVFIIIITAISNYLQPHSSSSRSFLQVYSGGETISAKERHYLETTFQYCAYFAVLDILGFFLGTLFIRSFYGLPLLIESSFFFIIILFIVINSLVTIYPLISAHHHGSVKKKLYLPLQSEAEFVSQGDVSNKLTDSQPPVLVKTQETIQLSEQ
jgi:hypothetical protein